MESRKRMVGRHNDNDNCNNSHNGVHSFDKLHSKNCEQKKLESSIVPAMHACTPEYFGAASIFEFCEEIVGDLQFLQERDRGAAPKLDRWQNLLYLYTRYPEPTRPVWTAI